MVGAFSSVSRYGRCARISRPKLAAPGKHEGVLLPSGLVVHNTARSGIVFEDLETFRANRYLLVESELPEPLHPLALSRLQEIVNRNAPYDALTNNCENFARAVMLEDARSPQVATWVLLSALVAYGLHARR